MKAKNLKKLTKLICEEMRKNDSCSYPVKAEYSGDWSEYNLEISNKFKKMILNLADCGSNVHISIDERRIIINTSDITTVKKVNNNKNRLSNDDNYVEMILFKDLGFTINYGYRIKSNYKDENLYDELLPILSQKLKEISETNFNNIWDQLMKDSGFLRESNLDDILG